MDDENPEFDITMHQIVGDHLELLSHNFSLLFPQIPSDACNRKIVSLFIMQYIQDSNINGENKDTLVDLSQEIEKKVNC